MASFGMCIAVGLISTLSADVLIVSSKLFALSCAATCIVSTGCALAAVLCCTQKSVHAAADVMVSQVRELSGTALDCRAFRVRLWQCALLILHKASQLAAQPASVTTEVAGW
jgi:hypothetical protein